MVGLLTGLSVRVGGGSGGGRTVTVAVGILSCWGLSFRSKGVGLLCSSRNRQVEATTRELVTLEEAPGMSVERIWFKPMHR